MPEKTDVILLPEGMTVAGTGKGDADVSEPVPGPTTQVSAKSRGASTRISLPASTNGRRRRFTTPPF